MLLEKLYISGFRNLEKQEVSFVPSVNFIIGKNGQGKTNLIESIFLLANAKSFRSSKISDLLNWDDKQANIWGKVKNQITTLELEVELKSRKKKFLLNSKPTSTIIEYIQNLTCICFTPEDLRLVKGEPSIRRKFLDRHTVDIYPEILKTMVDYNRAIKSKNILLKDENINREMVFTWNKVISKCAKQIIEKRALFVNKLEKKINEVHTKYAKEDGNIKLSVVSNLHEEEIPTEEDILLFLNDSFDQERRRGRSIYGPHRDDLSIDYSGRKAHSFASQGQSRSIALSLKFAVVEMIEEKQEESPIILLDDLDSELDSDRALDLFSFLYEKQRQIFITGTEIRESVMNIIPENSKIFVINGGTISVQK